MKNEYLETKNKEKCNGCGICTLVCPVNAISMVEDSEGFFYPSIDNTKCIGCNKCKSICSNYNDTIKTGNAYLAINKNTEELSNSASGGMFYILAKYIIEKKGVVFGVEYDENLNVQHNYYETIEECKKFQGSKYIRSNLRDSFQKAKKFLEDNRYVLFTGTPCQCNALKTYLKKDYEKLILCDIICHANPSQKVFNKYKDELEKKYGKRIVDFKFRDKANGWHGSIPNIYFNDKAVIKDRIFYEAFVSELFNRPSCHECKFASFKRVTDFTIGDLWGIEKIFPEYKDNNTGISLLLVNSSKGENVFNDIKNQLEYREVDYQKAFECNHYKNVPPHKNRNIFFSNLEKMTVEENIKKCLKLSFFAKVKRKVKTLIKKIF